MSNEPKTGGWTRHRPAGEWQVNLTRGQSNYEWGVRIRVQGVDGKLYMATIVDGLWAYRELGGSEVGPPTFTVGAMLMEELVRALERNYLCAPREGTSGGKPRGPDHLADAIATRDRLLAVVEETHRRWPRPWQSGRYSKGSTRTSRSRRQQTQEGEVDGEGWDTP